MIVAVITLPPKPLSSSVIEDWTPKLPPVIEFNVGVNLSPALPSPLVIKVLLPIAVLPSFLYNVPPTILVILK
jgi:hypothetical protein